MANASDLRSVTVKGGKTFTTNFAKFGVLTVGDDTISGVRFNARVESKDTQVFVPTRAITGLTGELTGNPEYSAAFALAGVTGVHIEGGKFIPVTDPKAQLVDFGNAGASLVFQTVANDGTREFATMSLDTITAFVGDLRTDDERADDVEETNDRRTASFARTRGTDVETYGKAAVKQTNKAGQLICGECNRPIRPDSLPVYVRAIGIVHRDARCNYFTRDGLLKWNSRG